MNLMKEMPKVAAKVLKNTRGIWPDFKSRINLLADAYGAAAVLRDFEEWCESKKGEPTRYPISDYLKVVDSRLGSVEILDTKNPQVAELISLVYELTSVLPSAEHVAELLAVYPMEEVKPALIEYAENLTEKETKTAIRNFFAHGGAGASAVILARRRQAQQ